MDLLNLMQSHVSVRYFDNTPLDKNIKEKLVLAAHSASTSNFVQAVSIIDITDMNLRKKLAEISGSDAYVMNTGAFFVFVADLHRQAHLLEQNGQSLAGVSNMESLTVSVVDTALAAQNMALEAEALGLGICYIGGIRNDIFEVANLLNLPDHTVPLFSLTIGKPLSKNAVKPRLPLANFYSENGYDEASFTDLRAYDEITEKYYGNRQTNAQTTNWSEKNREFFAEIRRPQVAEFLKKQGFSLES